MIKGCIFKVKVETFPRFDFAEPFFKVRRIFFIDRELDLFEKLRRLFTLKVRDFEDIDAIS